MSFTRRHIDLTFQLGQGDNGLDGYETLKVSGLRTKVELSHAGGPSLGHINAKVYGLPLDMMNKLSPIIRNKNGNINLVWNHLIIDAGDDLVGMSTIFEGQITMASIDMASNPESSLDITGFAGASQTAQAVEPSPYPDHASVEDIMKDLSNHGKLNGVDYNGDTVTLYTPYLSGTVWDQIKAVAEAADLQYTIERDKIILWPRNGHREVPTINISPTTGMMGYPTNWGIGGGVQVTMVFNPNLVLGGLVHVESQLAFANADFVTFNIGHELESEMPNGRWQSTFQGSPYIT